MKKVIFAISMLAVAFGFTACSNEDEAVNNAKKGKATVVAFTENETRTALSGDDTEGYQVVWSEGDKITIGTETFDIDEKSIAGTTAKFTGNTLAEDTYTALYGINEMVWPSKQTYKEGNVANFPMYASATVDTEGNISPLSFKNLGGLLRLTVKVKGESTRKIKSIEIASSNKMAGPFTIKNDAASIVNQFGTQVKSIVLDCGSDGVALSASGTDFYIAMAQNTTGYSDIKITLTDTKDNVCVKKLSSDKKLVITRSQITKASFTVDEKKFVPGITANSPVGTVGLLNEVEGMVVELNGTKVVIATKNLGATTIGEGAGSTDPEAASCYGSYAMISQETPYFTFTGIGNLGWRMPTKAELEALAANLKWSGDRYGAIWNVTDAATLFLPAAGFYNNNVDKNSGEVYGYINVGTQGLYACQKERTSSFYNALSFNAEEISVWNIMGTTSTILNPNLGLLHNCTIRPFHDMPTE